MATKEGFSNERLARLKVAVEGRHTDDWISLDPAEVSALLARLDCAETLLTVIANLRPEIQGLSKYKEWIRSKGESV